MRVALRLLRRSGFDLVRFPYPEHAQLRSALSRVLKALDINCVLDVGANEGQFKQMLRGTDYSGWIVSFEPVATVREKLTRATNGDSRSRVFPFALGATERSASINVTVGTGFSSLLTPDPTRALHFAHHSKVERTERVEVKRLDAVWETALRDIPNPRVYLKMDTQGYDPEVFAGAQGVLAQIAAMQTEVSLHHLYTGMTDAFEGLALYRSKGFDLVECIPVARKADGLAIVEMDCILVNQAASACQCPAAQTVPMLTGRVAPGTST